MRLASYYHARMLALDGWVGGRAGGEIEASPVCAHVCEHVRTAKAQGPQTPRARRGKRAEPWLMRRGNASLTLLVAEAWYSLPAGCLMK